MAVTSIAEVRRAVAARIAALGGDWNEAEVPFDRFGEALVPDHIPDTKAQCAFAVGVPATPEITDRQNTTGAWVKTTLLVRFLSRARAAAAGTVASGDDALDLEHDVIRTLCVRSTEWPGALGFALVLDRRSQACRPPFDWFMHEITFEAQHRLALHA